jgi:hypothetical protein
MVRGISVCRLGRPRYTTGAKRKSLEPSFETDESTPGLRAGLPAHPNTPPTHSQVRLGRTLKKQESKT